MLVLAVTDQEAEIIKLSREQGNGITLVLRGRGDTAVENTVGATIDLLVSHSACRAESGRASVLLAAAN